MMTSSKNGNIFRVNGHLCGEFTGHRWIPSTKASDAELWCFFDLRPNKRWSKQSWGWWFDTPHHDVTALWFHFAEAFFDGMKMEAAIYYFVSSCATLNSQQVVSVKEEFLDSLMQQHVCTETGLLRCAIDDVILECGVTRENTYGSSELPEEIQFNLNVTVPDVRVLDIDCEDICPRHSYCDRDCSTNYRQAAESLLNDAAVALADALGPSINGTEDRGNGSHTGYEVGGGVSSEQEDVDTVEEGQDREGGGSEGEAEGEDDSESEFGSRYEGYIVRYGGVSMLPNRLRVNDMLTWHNARSG